LFARRFLIEWYPEKVTIVPNSESQRVSDGLRQAEVLVQSYPDAALLVDANLHWVAFNQPYLLMTGGRRRASLAEMEDGARPFKVLGRSEEVDSKQAQLVVSEGRFYRFDEVEISNGAGDRFNVIMVFAPVISEGRVIGVIVTYRDVTAESQIQNRYKELLALEKARAEDLERQVRERTQELSAALEEVTRLSRRDPLTGLFNRRAFMEYADKAIALAQRHDRPLGVMMCDLDHFKQLNDTYGHQAGDKVLIAVAKALNDGLRESDIVGRYGGEEFIVLLGETPPELVRDIADRCCGLIRSIPISEIVEDKKTPQTISVGVAAYPNDASTLTRLIEAADEALYVAKETGRNRVALARDVKKTDMGADAAATEPARPRILVVGTNEEQAQLLRDSLKSTYEIIFAASRKDGIESCRNTDLDILLVDEDLADTSGIDFLWEAFPIQPDCLRILITDSRDSFAAIRSGMSVPIDVFILREDLAEYVNSALENGLARREFAHQHITTKPASTHRMALSASPIDLLIHNRRLEFVYQAIVDLPSNKALGYEALCRPPSDLFPSPVALFDSAVHLGRIWRLSRLVREMAVEPLGSLDSNKLLFLNLNPADVSDPEFLNGESFLRPWANRLVFEITERASIHDLDRFREHIEALKAWGYRFAVDDLGAGYASLNSITVLDPDFVKIDMMMIRGITKASPKAKLIRRILEFAADADIAVIAEGVETAQEAEVLVGLGCKLAQGFYFASPEKRFVVPKGFSS